MGPSVTPEQETQSETFGRILKDFFSNKQQHKYSESTGYNSSVVSADENGEKWCWNTERATSITRLRMGGGRSLDLVIR